MESGLVDESIGVSRADQDGSLRCFHQYQFGRFSPRDIDTENSKGAIPKDSGSGKHPPVAPESDRQRETALDARASLDQTEASFPPPIMNDQMATGDFVGHRCAKVGHHRDDRENHPGK